jgi:outer membrane protein assembly factor BamD (BamD/ComL family)
MWKLFYNVTLMASRFVNDYCDKTGILSTTFATREQYSQKLCDIYVAISDAKKLLREFPRMNYSTAASVVSQRLHHLFAYYEYTI